MFCTLCVLLCIHYDCFYICKDLTEGEINQSINQFCFELGMVLVQNVYMVLLD